MKYVFMVIIMIPLFIQTHVNVMNTGIQENAFQQLTYALEDASHAASLQVEPTSIANGAVIFDQTAADAAFRKSLAVNMDLNPTTLVPNPHTSFSQGDVAVKLEQFIDASDAIFPMHYVNAQYGIDTTLTEPCIVYAVQVTIPSIVHGQKGFTRTWETIQGYASH